MLHSAGAGLTVAGSVMTPADAGATATLGAALTSSAYASEARAEHKGGKVGGADAFKPKSR